VSRLERVESDTSAGEIEPGKRLIRVGDDRGLSLFERLNHRLHRLAWKTPLHRMRLRGRVPLKLIAVPKDPIAGDKGAGEALLAGVLSHNGTEVPLADLDFATIGLPEDFSAYLHSFAWLRDLSAAATRERGAKIAEGIARKWLAAFAEQISEPAWRADLWGRRVLFWTAYAPYILSSSDLVYRSSLLYSLARGARHLERSADKGAPGLPRIAAWSGVIAAALVVQGGPARLKTGEAGLARAIAASFHDDGGLVSRSPSEQLAAVEILSQLRAVYAAGRRDVPEWLTEALVAAIGALLAVTLGDDALSSWQGGHKANRRRVAAALEGAGLDVIPLRQARGWGYQRLSALGTIVVLDAAPPPSQKMAAQGSASTLAFELSDGPQRLVVNCGGPGPLPTDLSDELVQGLASTAAHSTLVLADTNSTNIQADGSLGKGVEDVTIERTEDNDASRLEASHDGYARAFGLVHKRSLMLGNDGKELRGADQLLPKGRKKIRESAAYAVRFHLAPAIEVTKTADGMGAILTSRGTPPWNFRCRGGSLLVEESLWIDGRGRPQPTTQLVVVGEVSSLGGEIGWQFRRTS